MLKKIFIATSFLFITSCMMPSPPQGEARVYYQASTTKRYEEVLAELEVAISEYNFRITGHSRVGKVIRDRGARGFPNYDTLQFCNLTHAKTLLEISPHAIRHMPCNIVTYEYQGQTIIKTPLLPTNTAHNELNRFSEKINEILKAMVDFAAEE